VNLISDVGRAGYIRFAGVRAFGEADFLARSKFVRDEATRLGRDPKSLKISSIVFQTIITDSPAATRGAAEGMAGGMGIGPDEVLRHPLFLLGTPDECVTELRRRAQAWDLAEIVFGVRDPALLRRLGEEVLAKV
jgi:alkanesulfonate monooxygenase SsuD/methylene tetrahydromethanopterin reductase-like flavin-dependent oxidoreductase (luciferase family)